MVKYELTDEVIEKLRVKLHRIRALKDFGDVKKGDLGGYVESESNLSHEHNCWVSDNAIVLGRARVNDDAIVYGNAIVCDNADVYGNARIYDEAKVYDNTIVCGDVRVYDEAEVYGNARVYGNAEVYGNAIVCGNADVCGNVEISNTFDYMFFKNHWSSGRFFTYTKPNKMWTVGCFYGTGEELIAKAYKDSKLSGDCYKEYVDFVKRLENLCDRN